MTNASTLILDRLAGNRLANSSLRFNYAQDIAAPALAMALGAGRVWIFGSAARGESNPCSDIDLLIEGGDGLDAKRRLFLAADVVESLDAPCGIDVIVLTEAEIQQKADVPAIKSMMTDRRLIYERGC